MHVMRLAAIITLAFALSAAVASGAAVAPSGGSFEVKGGRGMVQITGKGVRAVRHAQRTLMELWSGVPHLEGGRA